MNKEFNRMLKLAGLMTEGLYTSDEKAPMEAMSSSKMKKSELKEKIKEMMTSGDTEGGMGRQRRMYFHVLEQGSYGDVKWQGVYNTKEEAQKRVGDLVDMFPGSRFYVESSYSRREPVDVTIEEGTIGQQAYAEEGSLDEASPEAMDRMAGLAPVSSVGSLIDAARRIISALKEEGFEEDDIYDYIMDKVMTLSMDETLSEAKKDEESDTEDVIVANTEEEVPAEADAEVIDTDTQVDVNMDGTPDVDTGSAESKKAFTSLVDTYNASKELGDPKLTQMIANALTYYNKNIILKTGQAQA